MTAIDTLQIVLFALHAVLFTLVLALYFEGDVGVLYTLVLLLINAFGMILNAL